MDWTLLPQMLVKAGIATPEQAETLAAELHEADMREGGLIEHEAAGAQPVRSS